MLLQKYLSAFPADCNSRLRQLTAVAAVASTFSSTTFSSTRHLLLVHPSTIFSASNDLGQGPNEVQHFTIFNWGNPQFKYSSPFPLLRFGPSCVLG